MDKAIQKVAPYFDPRALREELTASLRAHGDAAQARPALIERLKGLVATARQEARSGLEADGSGRRCAAGLSQFQDELIRVLYDYTVAHVYRATNPSDAERMAIVATGGYGRGLLAPFSDIDLLFLLPYKQTAWGESVAEYMLYVLWDLGFKVGHATRTIDQCIKMSSDITVRTALLDSRLVHGDAQLFATFTQRFRNEVVAGTARGFIDAKMAERDARHRAAGESRYKVEPNIKDGKGGLRDLHTLHWLSKYLYGQGVGAATVAAGIFQPEEVTTFRRCEDFLWTIRCYLHFLSGRAEEVLTFDVQPWLAEQLGYNKRGGLRAVERFMKHYFLIAKDVGDLTTILCTALEMQQLKASPGLSKFLRPLNWKARRQIRTRTEFRIDNDRLNVADPDVFKRDPVNLIRFFAEARHTNCFLHPDAIRLLRQSRRLIDDELRANPDANRIFLELLTKDSSVEMSLRRMNEAGVLGRFVPEFGRVVGMTQFNMYHHYTIDEHLVRTIGMLADIERGGASRELPLSTEIISTIQNRRALFVAAFLHDIGKGHKEDHSIVGRARRPQARAPLRPDGRRDGDRRLAHRAALDHEQHRAKPRSVRSQDHPRLRRRRAKPGASEAVAACSRSPTSAPSAPACGTAGRASCCARSTTRPSRWSPAATPRSSAASASPRRRTSCARRSAIGVRPRSRSSSSATIPTTGCAPTPIARSSTPSFCSAPTAKAASSPPRRRRTPSRRSPSSPWWRRTIRVCCRCSPAPAPAAGANIAGAHIMTTRDGFALDTFLLNREFKEDEDEFRRGRRIGDTIERLLRGEVWLKELLAARGPPRAAHHGLHGRARGHHQQHDLGSVHRDRGRRPRPAGPPL